MRQSLLDGYTAPERGKFEKDARRLVDVLLKHEPYRSRRKDLNVFGLCPPADERGVSRPLTGIHRRTRIGATYDVPHGITSCITLPHVMRHFAHTHTAALGAIGRAIQPDEAGRIRHRDADLRYPR